MTGYRYFPKFFILLAIGSVVYASVSNSQLVKRALSSGAFFAPPDSTLDEPDTSTTDLPFPFNDREGDFYTDPSNEPFNLGDPGIIDKSIVYDPITGQFIIQEKIGNLFFRDPMYLSFEDFLKNEFKRQNENYWMQRSEGINLLGRSEGITLAAENEALDRLFGGSSVEIRPKGNIELIFGGSFQNIENPTLPERARKQGGFDFDMNINMSVLGKIGDKMKLTTNYNTQATFDFENQVKIEYAGTEDEIIQLIEAGNVSFPLNSSLITGSQSLFGLKTKLKFGRLNITSVLSQQKSKRENIRIEGGAQTRDFEIEADDYDENRHFFLGHYFRDNYEQFLSTMPINSSPVNVTRTEVWVTNSTGYTENTRDIVGFMDLGEKNRIHNSATFSPNPGDPIPRNDANTLYSMIVNTNGTRQLNTVISVLTTGGSINLEPITDFEKTRARKLDENEYTLFPQLGFISLNQSLKPDEVLAVAFEFTYQGKTYRVGEFSQDIPIDPDDQNVLFLKMLKSTSSRPKLPIWDLMMKNIYALGAYQVNSEDFRLDILYQDPGGGKKRYIPEGEDIKNKPIIRLLSLDRLNNQLDPQPDGVFDFVPGVTINPNNGRVIFPVVEPFGDYLRKQFEASNPSSMADKYVFDILYDSTKTIALQFPQFNRFSIEGTYKSSVSSEIYLGAFNVPRGSVTVTAGGQQLKEGSDYTIDYNLGRVQIINDGIMNSGVPINISFENNALFGFQTKTLIGNRFDYWINDNFIIGATQMHLSERPYTQKVNFGDDPISNSIYGLDVKYSTELPALTRLLDRLPIYSTTEKSSLDLTAEGAWFKPGHSRAINQDKDNKGGIVYIDDFEGSKSSYDLKFPYTSWSISSTPHGSRSGLNKVQFPESGLFDSLAYGFNRSKLIWYSLDPIFIDNNSATPPFVKDHPELKNSHYVRIIDEKEIFEKENQNLLNTRLATFDLAYYPENRGPYNYESSKDGIPGISKGVHKSGLLKDPASRWGGIMRSLETNDFEAANVEFIDFWLMDPFDNRQGAGELYINLGNVSEDILKDSRKFFENGLPKPGTTGNLDTTKWGLVPKTQAVTNAFDTDPAVLEAQDVGYDGLTTEQEKIFFKNTFLQKIEDMYAAGDLDDSARQRLLRDPSTDNFVDYLDDSLDNLPLGIIQRYNQFDGAEGNTSANVDNNQFSHGSNLPNSEDLNRDNTLNETEEYFQYKVDVYDGMTVENHPFITDVVKATADFNGQPDEINWYHFKIPIEEFDNKIGGIQDFKSIRFVRMFLTNFEEPVVMRFARLELVRNQWRRYKFSLLTPGEYIPNDNDASTFFNVSAVSVEENSSKQPIPYLIPPGVEREQFIGNNAGTTYLQNEQSLQLEVCGLQDGDARAIYKTLNFDFRKYKRLELFIHAESYTGEQGAAMELQDGEMEAFIRLGDDFTENYYEFSLPLKVTDPDDVNGADLVRRMAVWPNENKIDLLLDSLRLVKQIRNINSVSATEPFSIDAGNGRTITIVGNPNLGNVKTAMLGLRNPKEENELGREICGEVWVNEFRLNGLDEKGGGAGLVRADLKLADLGNITLAGSFHTIGFGQLEQKVNDRYMDDFLQYDASTNLELGKLLPKKLGLRIPMYAGISKSFSKPEYDPYDLDIDLDEKLTQLPDSISRKDYLAQVQDFTSIKSLNFTNVRKEKGGKSNKSQLWDISNFNVTYAFTETFKSSPMVTQDLIRRSKGGLAYTYSTSPKYITPFQKLIGPKNKYLRLIRDFNFNLIPTKLSFRTDLNRQYGELVLRDIYGDALIDTTYNKYFNWDRFYDMRWDITKSLKLDFSAVNRGRIDEPDGKIDTKAEKDSVWANIKNLGRTTNYHHNINLNYTLPFSKIPLLDWVNVRAAYSTDYDWVTAPLQADTLGNTISNTRSIRLNGDLNFSALYNKVGFLKKYTAPQRPRNRPNMRPEKGGDQKGGKENQEDKNDKNKDDLNPGVKFLVGLITGIKRVSLNYNKDNGTTLPGYMPRTNMLGMDRNFSAPGFNFITGYQPDSNWLNQKALDGWITTATTLNFQYLQNEVENLDIKATIEPIQNFQISLNWKKNFSINHSEYFRFDDSLNRFMHLNPMQQGNYTISFLSYQTIFDKLDPVTGISETYKNFEKYREDISNFLGERNPYSVGTFKEINAFDSLVFPEYADGYGPYSQEVLIPAFMAAYTGKQPGEISLNVLNNIPKPNWRITYNGLSKIKPLDQIFSSFNISHGYSSNLTVSSFMSDFNFTDPQAAGYPKNRDTLSGNFYARYNIPQIIIAEQFAPLIGIDVTTKKGFQAKFEFKKTRNLTLSLIDYQLIENKSAEITLGAGYRVKGFVLPFRVKGKKKTLENDLNFRFDFSLRDDRTVNNQLDQDLAVPTKGSKSYSIAPSVDYVVNDRLNVKLFFDRKKTIPYTSASYPVANTKAGVSVRFTLAE